MTRPNANMMGAQASAIMATGQVINTTKGVNNLKRDRYFTIDLTSNAIEPLPATTMIPILLGGVMDPGEHLSTRDNGDKFDFVSTLGNYRATNRRLLAQPIVCNTLKITTSNINNFTGSLYLSTMDHTGNVVRSTLSLAEYRKELPGGISETIEINDVVFMLTPDLVMTLDRLLAGSTMKLQFTINQVADTYDFREWDAK